MGGSKVEVKGQYFFFNFFSSILTFFQFFFLKIWLLHKVVWLMSDVCVEVWWVGAEVWGGGGGV